MDEFAEPASPKPPAPIPENETPAPDKRERPLPVMAVAVLLLIFGALGILTAISNIYYLTHPSLHATVTTLTPERAQMQLLLQMASAPLCLVMGIGLLRMARWARVGTLLTIYSLFAYWLVLNLLYLYGSPTFTSAQRAGNLVFLLIEFVVVGGLVCVLVTYLFTRPAIVAAFEEKAAEEAKA